MNVRVRLPDRSLSTIVAGAMTGVVGALLFATAHAIVIVPIWDRMFSGFVTGPLAGAAAGWALVELVPAVRAVSPARALALGASFGGLLWLLVTPVTLFDVVLRRYGVNESSEFVEVTVALVLAAASGGAFAWWRTHRWTAALSAALATVMLTVAMAGPVPIANGSRAVAIFLSVLAVAVLSGAVLSIAVRLALRPRFRSNDAPG